MVNGIELALKQVGNKAGDITVNYESLDDSTAQAGSWTPEATSANARKAAQDDATAAYIGEFNSGASAVSIPILNEAGVPQISPANTAVGLTTDEPGADKGEPDKYYPSGERTYARIVPKDTIQGAALATLMKEDGCTKVQLLNDKEVYGAGLARNIEASAKEQGLEIISNEAIDKNAANYRSLAARAKGAGADCMVFSGITANSAVQLYKDFAAALPDAKLYGPDGVAESGFADPKEGGIPAGVGSRVKVTVATLTPDEYPPEGQKFFQDFEEEYSEKNPDPYAIYGYEAMRLRWTRSSAPARQEGGRAQGDLRDEGSRERARHLLDRRERRHVADRLRHLLDRRRRAEVRQDHQGAATRTLPDVRTAGSETSLPAARAVLRSYQHHGSRNRSRQPRVRGDRMRPSSATYGLIAVLLALPVSFAIYDLRQRGRPLAARQQPRRRPLQRRHLGARGHRLHPRLRHRRADQLRPRRGVHDRLVRRGQPVRAPSGCRRTPACSCS